MFGVSLAYGVLVDSHFKHQWELPGVRAYFPLEQMSVPRTASRILAYLLVSEVPEQSMQDLVKALQLSKSSVSSAIQTLLQFQLIERVSLPGKRPDFYRVGPGLWRNLIQTRTAHMAALRTVAEQGLNLLADAPAQQKGRLTEMQSLFFSWKGRCRSC